MWRVGVIILPGLFGQAAAQNSRINWVGMSEGKLRNRARKVQHIQNLDSTMLMKGGAMPQQSFTSTVARAAHAFKVRAPKMAAPQIPFLSKDSIYRTAHQPYSSLHNDHFSRQPFVRTDHNTMQANKALNTQDLTSAADRFSREHQVVSPEQKVALFFMVAQAIVHEAIMPSQSK